MQVEDIFEEMNKAIVKNSEKSIQKNKTEIAKLILKIEMIGEIHSQIQNECIDVLEEVINDLSNSIVFMTMSFYRNAMMCLRSALELALSYIYYTDKNYEFLLWKNDKIDMTWSKLTDGENGVLSAKYLSLFVDELDVVALSEKIRKCYHESSQYVHGKYSYMQSIKQPRIEFDEVYIDICLKQLEETIDCIVILLFVRFGKQYNLKENTSSMMDYLRPLMRNYGGIN